MSTETSVLSQAIAVHVYRLLSIPCYMTAVQEFTMIMIIADLYGRLCCLHWHRCRSLCCARAILHACTDSLSTLIRVPQTGVPPRLEIQG